MTIVNLPASAMGDLTSFVAIVFKAFAPYIYLCVGVYLGFYVLGRLLDILDNIREKKELERLEKMKGYKFREQEITRYKDIGAIKKELERLEKMKGYKFREQELRKYRGKPETTLSKFTDIFKK